MAQAALAAIPIIGDLVGGVVDQVGSGIRESNQHDYKMDEMAKEGEITRENLRLKEELSEKEAQKLLDLELKKMDLESKIYKDKSGVDVDRYRQMALVDQDLEKLKTEDELKVIQAKYGGQSDLLKLQMNQQAMMNQYQPTRMTDYNIYSSVGAYGPLNSPMPQLNYSQPYVPFRKTPSYKAGLTGHKIEQA